MKLKIALATTAICFVLPLSQAYACGDACDDSSQATDIPEDSMMTDVPDAPLCTPFLDCKTDLYSHVEGGIGGGADSWYDPVQDLAIDATAFSEVDVEASVIKSRQAAELSGSSIVEDVGYLEMAGYTDGNTNAINAGADTGATGGLSFNASAYGVNPSADISMLTDSVSVLEPGFGAVQSTISGVSNLQVTNGGFEVRMDLRATSLGNVK
jgi:hypothetical protein